MMEPVLNTDDAVRPPTKLGWKMLPVFVFIASAAMASWRFNASTFYTWDTAVTFSMPAIFALVAFLYLKKVDMLQQKHLAQEKIIHNLAEMAGRYRNTFDNAMEGIFQISPDGRLINCNRALAEIYGFKTEQELMTKKGDAWLLLYADTAMGLDIVERIWKNGQCTDLESQAIRRNGRIIWISATGRAQRDSAGKLLYYEGTIVDITRRKLAEDALVRSEHRFHTFMDNNPAVVFLKDDQGRYLYVNKTLERVFSIKREDIVGKSDYDWLPKEAAEETRRNDAAVLEGGKLVEAIERVQTKTGQDRWWFSFKFPMDDPSGARVVAGVSLDITERQEAEISMARARDLALQSTRMKSEFLANMSHEIRTPMNGLVGMSDLLLETALTPRQIDYTRTIRSSADSLLYIINDILDFSKIEAGMLRFEKIEFSLAPVVQDSIALLAPKAAEKGIEMIHKFSPDLPKCVIGDPGRLRQILVNLLGNAVKFTDSGTVSVEVNLRNIENNHAQLEFAVKDTGIGLSEDQISRLFEPFSQADGSTTRKYGGTGLGLAISKQLVSCMSGNISVQAELGAGSTFSFDVKLPIGDQVSQTDVSTDTVDDFSRGQIAIPQMKILLADDNPVNRKVALHQLERLGLTATFVVNGREAVEAVVADPEIDLILMDCQMPVMDGYEATKVIRELQTRHIHIIAMTAHSLVGDRDKCLACGMDDYLSKPVDLAALRAAILRSKAPPNTASPVQATKEKVTVEASGAPVIDPAKVSNDLDDLDFYKTVGELFLSHTPKLLAEARNGLATSDIAGLKNFAHTLRGSCSPFGAMRLTQACSDMEYAVGENQAQMPALLDRVEKEFIALKEIILEKTNVVVA